MAGQEGAHNTQRPDALCLCELCPQAHEVESPEHFLSSCQAPDCGSCGRSCAPESSMSCSTGIRSCTPR